MKTNNQIQNAASDSPWTDGWVQDGRFRWVRTFADGVLVTLRGVVSEPLDRWHVWPLCGDPRGYVWLEDAQLAAWREHDPVGKESARMGAEIVELCEQSARSVLGIDDGVKMDESLTERQQIHKLEEDIRHLVARCRKAEAERDTARDRADKAEAEIKRLRAAMADTVKMDETPSKDQQIRKLDEEADLLLERACDAKNKLAELSGQREEAEATVLRGLWETAQAQAGSERERAEKAEADVIKLQAEREAVRKWIRGEQMEMTRLAKSVGL